MPHGKNIARVLHVDDRYRDNPDDFEILRRFLSERGFEVRGLDTFSRAEAVYRSWGYPEVIILDLQDEAPDGTTTEPGPAVGTKIDDDHPESIHAPWIIAYTGLSKDHEAVKRIQRRVPKPPVIFKSASPRIDAMEILRRFPQSLLKEVENRTGEGYLDTSVEG